jgi:small-conductance mechanosensitive channel
MDLLDAQTMRTLDEILSQLQIFAGSMLLPTRLWQFAIIAVAFAIAHLVAHWASPRFDDWVRRQKGLRPWQLRALVLLRKRFRGIVFVVLTWSAVLVLQQISPFPSRRFIVVFAATLATAWILVGLLARIIRNRFLRRIVTWGAWTYVTLYYLGLTETVGAFLDRFAIELGGFRLSALAVLKALVLTGVLFTGARLMTQRAATQIRSNEDISPSMRVLVVKFLQVLLYGAAFFIGLKAVGFDLTGLAVLSGAIGVGLGFGLQKVVSNLVSGIIILLDKSVKPGDVISLGDTFGWIESLGARYVSVVTRDGKEYLIPNEDLITGQVVNWSHSNEFVRIDLFFGTSYHDDPHKVRPLAIEAAKSVNRVLKDRPAVCHIVGFGDSSVDYILRFWITDPADGLTNVRGAVYLALWDAFRANGISIPFPQREVRLLPDAPPTAKAND